MRNDRRPTRLPVTILKPKDLYYLGVMTLVVAARAAPRAWSERLVGWMGRLAHGFSRRKRASIDASVACAFGDTLSQDARRSIGAEVFRECWRELLLAGVPPGGGDAVRPGFEGAEYLRQALAQGRGVIVWESRGFGHRLLAKHLLAAHGFPVHQIHGPNNMGGLLTDDASASWVRRAVLRPFFDAIERPSVASIYNLAADGTLTSARHLLGLLRDNAILCITGDGQAGQALRPVRFLDSLEPASTGMVTLAEMTGAPILPVFCARVGHRIGLVVERPIDINAALDRESRLRDAVQQFMDRLEAWVRRYPGQFRNWHLIGPRPVDAMSRQAAGDLSPADSG
jgi:lauroyl/myristoyl acyltransferase